MEPDKQHESTEGRNGMLKRIIHWAVFITAILIVAVVAIEGVRMLNEYQDGLNEERLRKQEVAIREGAVTVIDTRTVTVIFRNGFGGVEERRSMPYIIAENNKGETIMGIIDVTGFVKGDKIVVTE